MPPAAPHIPLADRQTDGQTDRRTVWSGASALVQVCQQGAGEISAPRVEWPAVRNYHGSFAELACPTTRCSNAR